jgi:hypothetical protein
MLSALLLALASPQSAVILSRGIEVKPGYTYWATEDASLDASDPDETGGSSLTLVGGPSKTILIRFGDLEHAVGPNRKIRSAKLVLTPLSEKPVLKEAARVLLPWSEGPMRPLIPKPSATPLRNGATWKSRQLGRAAWQSPGASGSQDAQPITGLSTQFNETEYVIDGLGPTVEAMRSKWYENHGLALRFESNAEFYSGQAQIGRPRLVLEVEDAPAASGPDLSVTLIEAAGDADRTYTAHVRNVGNGPSKGFSTVWLTDGVSGASVDHPGGLAAGEEATFVLKRAFKADDIDHRLQPLGLKVQPAGEDASPSNDYLEIQESGFPIVLNVAPANQDWAQGVVRRWNDVYSTQSRFSFALDGSLERVRVARFAQEGTPIEAGNDAALLREIGHKLGLTDLSAQQVAPGTGQVELSYGSVDPYAGIMGGGDTRYEGTVPGTLWLPYEPRAFETFEVIPPDVTHLLSATDVAALNANLGKTEGRTRYAGFPSTVILRAQDLAGRQLRGTELSFFAMSGGKIDLGAPSFTVATNEEGIAVLPKREGGLFGDLTKPGTGVLLVRTQANGTTAWAWLKAWQLADAFARGNGVTAFADLRFNVPGAPLETGTNLAVNRIVSDSANSAPVKLAALVDDNPATTAELPSGKDSWVEIDLGRDRTIGEIRLLAGADEMWQSFEVLAYGTGQLPSGVAPLIQERSWSYAANNRSDSAEKVRNVAYRFAGGRYRFIRLVNRGGSAGRLAEIRVTPAHIQE